MCSIIGELREGGGYRHRASCAWKTLKEVKTPYLGWEVVSLALTGTLLAHPSKIHVESRLCVYGRDKDVLDVENRSQKQSLGRWNISS